jgi:hypothetical protein
MQIRVSLDRPLDDCLQTAFGNLLCIVDADAMLKLVRLLVEETVVVHYDVFVPVEPLHDVASDPDHLGSM